MLVKVLIDHNSWAISVKLDIQSTLLQELDRMATIQFCTIAMEYKIEPDLLKLK